MFKAVVNRCDLCNNPIESNEDIELKIKMLKEIDDSFESGNDKQEPKLLLCNDCKKEYLLPSYVNS
jgi:uncharacterized protein with PIN domain